MNEEYPRVFKAFRPDPELRKKGALYFGPYMSGDLFEVLRSIENIFPLKRCKKVLPRDIGKERPCLNAHIGKCMAPCSGSVSAADYRKMIDLIVDFFKGRYDGIEEDISRSMEKASAELDFEKAGMYRDRLFALRNIRRSQRVFMEIRRDVDAIGVWADAGETCIRKLELREGRVVGSSTYFMTGEYLSLSEVISGFITQYYDDKEDIPPQIVIQEKIDEEDSEFLEEFLSTKAGRKVKIHVPERGELKEFSKLAVSNAREMMVRRILRGGSAGADPSAPLRYLEQLLGLKEDTLHRAESFDISNLGNDDICSGMVVFKGGRPDKQSYRLFKMKTVETQDDFASMRETLTRRFAHNKNDGFTYPDIILVDGGKGQLSAVASVVRTLPDTEGISLVGMVKNNRHKTAGIVFEDGRVIDLERKDKSDEEIALLRFLTAVQNEVHRFAVSYQRKLSGKRNIKYKLENIEGIGPAKRRILLQNFGTIKRVSEANVKELSEVKGISETDDGDICDGGSAPVSRQAREVDGGLRKILGELYPEDRGELEKDRRGRRYGPYLRRHLMGDLSRRSGRGFQVYKQPSGA